MKRSELVFGAALVPLDILMLLVAGASAYYLRVSPSVQAIRPATFIIDLPFVEYFQITAVVAAVIAAVFATQGLYAMQVTRRLFDEVQGIFTGISFGFMLVLIYAFLSAELFQSRFIVLAAYAFSLFFVTAGRILVRRVQQTMLARGLGVHRVVLVGNGRYGLQLSELLKEDPYLGYKIVGALEVVRWDQLEELYRLKGIDEVLQTDPSMPEEDNLILLDFCDKYKLDYRYVPNLFESYAAHVRYGHIGGVPVMALQRTPLEGWGRVAKRTVDIIGAIVGIIGLSPLLLATAAAISLDSKGPVLYSQTRVGKNKKTFNIYKFRSMKEEFCIGDKYGGKKAAAEEAKLRAVNERSDGPLFKMRNDPRITRVGSFIRKWRIDELPQFINVLRGEMSLLGPRPHLPKEVQRYDKHQQKLFTIKPGMSGMAQVNGNAGLSFDQEAALDVEYIEGWSLKLDSILLLKTFVLLVNDRNAV